MPPAPTPIDEPIRHAALIACAVLDTAREPEFDELTELAARLADAPIAAISLIDAERQWFKSIIGLNVEQTPRSQAFCGYTILRQDPFIVTDAATDPRTSDNPLVTGSPGIRAYAGVPLRLSTGEALGSLCVIDREPREFTAEQIADLEALAHQAQSQLELRRACALLEKANVEQRQIADAKSLFLANMSHEIRTPLTAILGYAELLATDPTVTADPTRVAQTVGTIRRNASYLLTIVNDVLDVSKIEAGRMLVERSPCATQQVLNDVVDLFQERAESAGLSLSCRLAKPIPDTIVSDATRLRQILVNLVGNAVKFTNQGGVEVEVDYDKQGSRLSFTVSDTGVGLSAEQLRRVRAFDAFTQADPSTTRRFGGSGLGLRIARSLAELLGGNLQIDSVAGVGTNVSFWVNAPVADNAVFVSDLETRDATEPPLATTGRAVPLAGRTILLAEDGPDNRALIRHFLENAGADVVIAEDGQQAVDAVTRGKIAIDAVLMDMQMPVLDGYDATTTLRNRGFRRPIVALTAHAMSGDRDRCLQAGCDDYLTKPIDRADLITAVARICARADAIATEAA